MWNHRVWRSIECGEEVFAIHETYYNESGDICACTENPASAYGYTADDLRVNLTLMLQATEKPVLDLEGYIFADWGE